MEVEVGAGTPRRGHPVPWPSRPRGGGLGRRERRRECDGACDVRRRCRPARGTLTVERWSSGLPQSSRRACCACGPCGSCEWRRLRSKNARRRPTRRLRRARPEPGRAARRIRCAPGGVGKRRRRESRSGPRQGRENWSPPPRPVLPGPRPGPTLPPSTRRLSRRPRRWRRAPTLLIGRPSSRRSPRRGRRGRSRRRATPGASASRGPRRGGCRAATARGRPWSRRDTGLPPGLP